MYALIWVAFIQILVVMFPVLETFQTYDLHLIIGVIVLAMAYVVYSRVKATPCPNRIKLITRTTFGLGVFQAVLGVALYAILYVGGSGLVINVIDFLHVVTAIAMITQASSSATAYDMWEEKEFLPAASSVSATTA